MIQAANDEFLTEQRLCKSTRITAAHLSLPLFYFYSSFRKQRHTTENNYNIYLNLLLIRLSVKVSQKSVI